MDACAPFLVTDNAAAILANLAASDKLLPSDKATANAPQKVSPAATVSITVSTLYPFDLLRVQDSVQLFYGVSLPV